MFLFLFLFVIRCGGEFFFIHHQHRFIFVLLKMRKSSSCVKFVRLFRWSFAVFVNFFTTQICFDTNQHSLNICWMNGKKKTSCLINEWVVCACVCVRIGSDGIHSDDVGVIFFSFFLSSLCHITSCLAFYSCWCCCFSALAAASEIRWDLFT